MSSEKNKVTNMSLDKLKNITDAWEKLELNNFIRALRPKSFRLGKKAFDACVEEGSKQTIYPN